MKKNLVTTYCVTSMKLVKNIALCGTAAAAAIAAADGFLLSPHHPRPSPSSAPALSRLHFFKGGSGAKDLDEEWERQQELLRLRQASPKEREAYFKSVEDRRIKATEEQIDKWAWQKKQYAKGEDPIDEWRKRRASGQISDLDNQYGDPRKIGGIPLPMASFGGERFFFFYYLHFSTSFVVFLGFGMSPNGERLDVVPHPWAKNQILDFAIASRCTRFVSRLHQSPRWDSFFIHAHRPISESSSSMGRSGRGIRRGGEIRQRR
jgi:hypothetical protein